MKKSVIAPDLTIKETLKAMDNWLVNTVFIESDKGLIASVSSGDIRRALLKEINLDAPISNIMHINPISVKNDYQQDEIKDIFLSKKISAIPVVDNKNKVCEVLLRTAVLEKQHEIYEPVNAKVVIMAGGKGARLDPFTQVLPKPLIPINDIPIIELVMKEFELFNIKDFFITINHKAEMIKAYFHESSISFSINYIEESKPLGTAGALALLPEIDKPFFVSNCDIIIKADYSDIYNFHIKGDFAMTLVASMQHHTIPYGVCRLDKKGELESIKEKPEYDFLINSGMYVINPDVIKYIPKDKYFDMTDLINTLKDKDKKIGVFPISEKSWIDIGQWAEYRKSVNRLNMLLEDIS